MEQEIDLEEELSEEIQRSKRVRYGPIGPEHKNRIVGEGYDYYVVRYRSKGQNLMCVPKWVFDDV
jgi:hypothetical protein